MSVVCRHFISARFLPPGGLLIKQKAKKCMRKYKYKYHSMIRVAGVYNSVQC